MDFQEAESYVHRWCNSYSRLPTILELAAQMPAADWLRLLGENWSTCDNIGAYTNQLLVSPFGERLGNGPIAEMMSQEAIALYDSLPEVVTVYRGCYSNNRRGLSWSLKSETAAKFPFLHRYRQQGQPLLLEAQAKKSAIAALFVDRQESEVITLKPNVIGITEIEVTA